MDDRARELKRRLRRMWHLYEVVASLEEQRDQIMAMATRATTVMTATRVSGTRNRSRVEDGAVRMLELAERLDASRAELVNEAETLQDALDRMENMEERRLLELRYMVNPHKTWRQINRAMHISERTSFYIHDRAVMHLADLLKC